MSWLQSIVLGIVQGLTEFLPISSSAHQLIVSRLFFRNDGGGAAFTAVTQLGTEAAVIVYFARDIGTILKHWFFSLTGKLPRDDPKAREGWYVILGTIPIGILGLVFKDAIEGPARNLWLTASMLLIFALVIAVADSTARQDKTLADLNLKDGLFFGLWQALSLIPGVSRSGGTISGGLFMGYDRPSAARYSFLLAIPAVLTSGLFELKGAHAGDDGGWGPIILATVISFVIGYAVIAWFLRWISSHDFRPFVYYRILLAVLLFVLLGVGALSPT